MTPNIRETLDLIDQVLAQNTHESQMLWDILTALRGPDNHAPQVKEVLTVAVRRKAFPQTAWATQFNSGYYLGCANGAQFVHFKPEQPLTQHVFDETVNPNLADYHFVNHAYRALAALEAFSGDVKLRRW